MSNAVVQLLGYVLAFIGFAGLVAATCMVEWKMNLIADGTSGIITSTETASGLWMSCTRGSTGFTSCEVFDSLFKLHTELQVTRALMVLSIVLSGVGVMVTMLGIRWTKCLDENQRLKERVAQGGGVIFILAGLCALAVTSWYGSSIVTSFHNPHTDPSHRYEFGRALYLSWGTASLSIVGGVLLCCRCCVPAPPTTHPKGRAHNPSSVSTAPAKEYV